jgi:hypothetical protein
MPLAWRLGTHTRKRPEIQTRRSRVWITINQRRPGQGRRRAGGGHARRWQLRALGRQRDRRVVGSNRNDEDGEPRRAAKGATKLWQGSRLQVIQQQNRLRL